MKNKQQQYDWILKIVVIGDSGVGKTNILLRLCDDIYDPSHLATIGIDFKIKNFTIDQKKLRLQIWDTAGQDRFKTLTQTYYKGAVGIALIYSITNRQSFNNIEGWVKQIKNHASQNVVKVLIGNKCDSQQRKVSIDEGVQLGKKFNIPYFQASAKENINIYESFENMTSQIKKSLDNKEIQLKPKKKQQQSKQLTTKQIKKDHHHGCSC